MRVLMRLLTPQGLAVFPIGIGAVAWGRDKGLKYASRLPSDAEIDTLVAEAESMGINLIDTAPAYGTSEERIGRALAGRRARWVIATKAGEAFDGERSSFDFSQAGIEASVTRSLQRLRTDYLDLVCIHSDGVDEGEAKFTAAAEALAELKARGDIRFIGFSGKTVEGGLWATRWADILMVTWNELDRDQAPVIDEARRRHVGVLAKKPLASGRLPASALRFATGTLGVAGAILGTTNPAHLKDAVLAIS
jgi:aryl-alcohol dehydrogenase-like predicted oxidoreductase